MSAPLDSAIARAAGARSAERGRRRVLLVGGCDVHLRIGLMRALADRYEVAAAGSERALGDVFARAGFEYHWFPLCRGGNPVRDYASYRSLRTLFRRLEPDIVHAFATKPCVWGRLAARSAGVPVVVGTIPGLGSLYSASSIKARAGRTIYEALQKLASSQSAMTIFQNEEDIAHFRRARLVTDQRSALVRGSGVETAFFDPARVPGTARARTRRELGLQPDSLVVTMVSRLIRSKGVLEFAAAAESVRAQLPAVEFLLVGPDDAGSMDRLSGAELGQLDRAVHRVGARSDIRAVLAVTDLFVLPSYYREGVPRSLLEAASMGLPLIATRMPGCSDVVEDGVNGVLVSPRDREELTRAIVTLLSDEVLRLRFGVASRRRACEVFDLKVIAREIGALYEQCLGNWSNL